MLYAILCYNDERAIEAWPAEKEDAVMVKLKAVQANLHAEGRLGPVARLMPTRSARTLKKDREPFVVVDGPFAETKEQLLGFYVIDCASPEDALKVARDLGEANPGGSFEIRPLRAFTPNTAVPGHAAG
jgi:hypothetical protein